MFCYVNIPYSYFEHNGTRTHGHRASTCQNEKCRSVLLFDTIKKKGRINALPSHRSNSLRLWYKFRFFSANVLLFHLLTSSAHPYHALIFTSSFGLKISMFFFLFLSFVISLFSNTAADVLFSPPALLLFVCTLASFCFASSFVCAAPFHTSSHVALSFVCTIIFVWVPKWWMLLLPPMLLLCVLCLVPFIYIHGNVDNIPASTLALASVHAKQFLVLSSVFVSAFSVFIRQCAIICVIA